MNRLAPVLLAIGLLLPAAARVHAAPVSSEFTYQGTLHQNGSPLTGSVDLEFSLFDALTGGNPIGVTQTINGVNVANGVFTVTLDFGTVFDGTAMWLQIGVQESGGGPFTTLDPRQALTASPYALYALYGPGGGGSLTLPFVGSSPQEGTTSTGDALVGLSPFAVTNTATTGVSHGLVGRTNSSWLNATGVLGVGTATTGNTSGVQGYATSSPTGTGMVGIGAANGAYFRGGDGVFSFVKTGVIGTAVEGEFSYATGVLGTVLNGTGVRGEATGGKGVDGFATTGLGINAESQSGTALLATSYSGHGLRSYTTIGPAALFAQNVNGYGVQGWTQNTAGVQGNGGANGRGVEGYANTQSGVHGASVSGRGVEGVATSAAGFGGYFYNTGGGAALYADGIARVKTLQILGGADVAERFDVEGEPEPGTVLTIDPSQAGRLRTSDEAYSHRVAGVVSGANELDAGVILSKDDRTEGTAAVALTGRVWVKCDATDAAIVAGDLLTSAPRAGHAMKAADRERAAGAVLGKAMTALPSGTGMVLVLVSLQ